MTDFTSGALALAMIAGFVLAAAGARQALTRKDRLRGVLMIVAGMVLVANVAIMTL